MQVLSKELRAGERALTNLVKILSLSPLLIFGDAPRATTDVQGAFAEIGGGERKAARRWRSRT